MTMNATKAEVLTEDLTMKAMVDRFLNWKLPQSFQPDCGISFNPHPGTWPIGTNVFTATEARQMLEHVLGAELTSLRALRDEAVKEREHEAWKHAACLTIAETGQKWGENVTPSLAMEKVFGLYHESKKLEQERDAALAEIKRLEGELDAAIASSSGMREALEWFKSLDGMSARYYHVADSALSQASSADALLAPGNACLESTRKELTSSLAEIKRLEGERDKVVSDFENTAGLLEEARMERDAVVKAVESLRKLLGGPGTGSIDLRPSRLRTAEELVAMSSTLKHTQALNDCCHCLVKVGGLWLKELVVGIDAALAQVSAPAPTPAKDNPSAPVAGWHWKCSNPSCRAIHNFDPSGRCPSCKIGDMGWSYVQTAPASAVSPASEEKEAKGERISQANALIQEATGTKIASVPAPAAPATSGAGRPVDGCHCISPLVGSWGDLPLDRIKPYGLDNFSAAKNCPDCGGTGRRPGGDTIHELEERVSELEGQLQEAQKAPKQWVDENIRQRDVIRDLSNHALRDFTAAALTGYIANGDYTPEECSTKAVECGRATLAAITGGGR